MEYITNILAIICFAVGAFFILTSAIGLVRMPDFFARLHPAGMSDSIGLPLILFGVIFQSEFGLITAKILIIIVLSMLTSSTASHALAKAALLSGMKPEGETIDCEKALNQKSGRKK